MKNLKLSLLASCLLFALQTNCAEDSELQQAEGKTFYALRDEACNKNERSQTCKALMNFLDHQKKCSELYDQLNKGAQALLDNPTTSFEFDIDIPYDEKQRNHFDNCIKQWEKEARQHNVLRQFWVSIEPNHKGSSKSANMKYFTISIRISDGTRRLEDANLSDISDFHKTND